MNTPDLSSARWRKSTRSGHEGGDCVEVAAVSPMVAIRDSKDAGGPVLAVTRPAFRAFIGLIRAGHHDG